MVPTPEKDPVKVRAGAAGAIKRWADPGRRTTVKIESLSTEEKRLVLALVAAAKSRDKAA